MICHRCLLRAARREVSQTGSRAFSQSRARRSTPISADKITSVPRQGSAEGRNPPSVISTSAAQPFSANTTPSPASEGITGTPAKEPVPVASSVRAGTPLKGLNFLKNGQDPVALADEEYPPWLWTILAPKERVGQAVEVDPNLFSKSRNIRRKATKKARREGLGMKEESAQQVPLQEQSIDLPSGDGTVASALEADAAREELTKAMRQKRRGTIKEANFLKSMG